MPSCVTVGRQTDDGRRFLGWMTAAIVGGALEWRPHLLLTAPSTQGKTWMLKNVLEKLMGPLLTQHQRRVGRRHKQGHGNMRVCP